jgi:hypothetical protein
MTVAIAYGFGWNRGGVSLEVHAREELLQVHTQAGQVILLQSGASPPLPPRCL